MSEFFGHLRHQGSISLFFSLFARSWRKYLFESFIGIVSKCTARYWLRGTRYSWWFTGFPSPSVCLRTDIFSFGSYWHEGGPRVYIRTAVRHAADGTQSFCANNDLGARKRADLSSWLPPFI